MRLNLDELRLRGGQKHICVYSIDVAPVVLGGAKHDVVLSDGVHVTVERIAGGYLVRVGLQAKVFGPCSRCLKETGIEVQGEEEEFVPTAAGGWTESESSPFVQEMVVDLAGLGREALVLAIPDRLLCSPECKGLCSHCGTDLNNGECGCRPLEI